MSFLLTPVAWLYLLMQTFLAVVSIVVMVVMYLLAFFQAQVSNLSNFLFRQQQRLRPSTNSLKA